MNEQEKLTRNIIQLLLNSAINISAKEVANNTKTKEQHELEIKDLNFYLTLLDNIGTLKLLPSKYAELCIGTLVLLLRNYKK